MPDPGFETLTLKSLKICHHHPFIFTPKERSPLSHMTYLTGVHSGQCATMLNEYDTQVLLLVGPMFWLCVLMYF